MSQATNPNISTFLSICPYNHIVKVEISSEIRLIELLHHLGICAEAVLLSIDGKLIPETATAKAGDELDIIFYKHVPPFLNHQEVKGHWKKVGGVGECRFCDANPVSYLPNFKKHLCSEHFLRSVEKRVKKTIRNYGMMIRKGERIGVGLSGGKDSFALLNVLSKVRDALPFELVAITIDEGITGYRDKAIENASRRCKELGIEQHVFSFEEEFGTTIMEISEKGKQNLCSYCGVLRRKILNSKARELNLDKIAIGHNLDDIAQTAMLNLVRNEPLRFARFNNSPNSSDKKLVSRIRPLREIREKEIAAYAFLKGHEFGTKCCCPHSKNAMRWSIRHELNSLEDQYPGTKGKIASSFDTLEKIIRDAISNEDGTKGNNTKNSKNKEKANFEMKLCKECGEPSSSDQCMSCKMLNEIL